MDRVNEALRHILVAPIPGGSGYEINDLLRLLLDAKVSPFPLSLDGIYEILEGKSYQSSYERGKKLHDYHVAGKLKPRLVVTGKNDFCFEMAYKKYPVIVNFSPEVINGREYGGSIYHSCPHFDRVCHKNIRRLCKHIIYALLFIRDRVPKQVYDEFMVALDNNGVYSATAPFSCESESLPEVVLGVEAEITTAREDEIKDLILGLLLTKESMTVGELVDALASENVSEERVKKIAAVMENEGIVMLSGDEVSLDTIMSLHFMSDQISIRRTFRLNEIRTIYYRLKRMGDVDQLLDYFDKVSEETNDELIVPRSLDEYVPCYVLPGESEILSTLEFELKMKGGKFQRRVSRILLFVDEAVSRPEAGAISIDIPSPGEIEIKKRVVPVYAKVYLRGDDGWISSKAYRALKCIAELKERCVFA